MRSQQDIVRSVSAEDMIRFGNIPVDDRHFPSKLANFLRLMEKPELVPLPRRSLMDRVKRFFFPGQISRRRLGTVGSIDGVGAASQGAQTLNWAVSVAAGLPSKMNVTGPDQTVATNFRAPVSYTLGTTGAGTINQVAQKTVQVTNGALNHFAIDVWTKNVVNDASCTFSAFRELWIELLTVAQGAAAGHISSNVIIGADAGQKWVGLLNAAGTYTLKAGGLWLNQDQTTAGIAITTGDLLQINNADAGNAGANLADVRLTAVGYK
jgi:hypothetical protein